MKNKYNKGLELEIAEYNISKLQSNCVWVRILFNKNMQLTKCIQIPQKHSY